jgi:hypothetical protein
MPVIDCRHPLNRQRAASEQQKVGTGDFVNEDEMTQGLYCSDSAGSL